MPAIAETTNKKWKEAALKLEFALAKPQATGRAARGQVRQERISASLENETATRQTHKQSNPPHPDSCIGRAKPLQRQGKTN
jgi:hypothetical protein